MFGNDGCIKGKSYMFALYDVFYIQLAFIWNFCSLFSVRAVRCGGVGHNICGLGPRFSPIFLVRYVDNYHGIFCIILILESYVWK